MRILIANSQADVLKRAARFAKLFAEAAGAELTLMGTYERLDREEELKQEINYLRSELMTSPFSPIFVKLRHGDAVTEIVAELDAQRYDLLVIGTYRNRRFKRGRQQLIVRRLIRLANIPVLVVPEERRQIKNVLICTGGGEHGEMDVWVGSSLAELIGAEVTVLHVMSQLPLIAAAYQADLTRDANEMIEHETREGRHLKKVLGIMYQTGLPQPQQDVKIRHGLVVDEIRREAREGDYDLIVVGAHEVPTEQPWNELRELLQDDITGQILARTRRPVLVVQSPPNGLRWP